MQILENYNIKSLNTFGVPAIARFFVEVCSEEDLKDLFENSVFKHNDRVVLGGGSNILFTKNYDGLIILNKIKGIEILKEDDESVFIKSMGGEVWHDLVEFATSRDYWGIENLALIPGTVGAAPMQNIGAYGAELEDTLVSIEGYNMETGKKETFDKEECELGYRDSVFKNELKEKYFISSIILRLSKKENKNLNYKILQEHLEKNKIEVKTSKDISDAVSEIRRSKLPDPKIIGNAGSFFKNVFVTRDELERLQKDYPEIPYFKEVEAFKIPTAWLIEQSGWKGKKMGNAGVHEKQALVLVNFGGAKGEDIKELSEKIIDSVYKKFGIKLNTEVNLI
ncbi:MAG: UDP-N-acetylmuramate dehydrogenase [Candidatus Paceibacterota bacterium]